MQVLEKISKFTPTDASHNLNHFIVVFEHAINAVKTQDLSVDIKDAICLAALLHDVDDRKFFSHKDYRNVRSIIPEHPHLELIIQMIKLVSFYENQNTKFDGEKWMLIPRLCDRLEAIGEIGIDRCLEYSRNLNIPMITEATPVSLNEEQLDFNIANSEYTGASRSVIDHFYEKLLKITIETDNPYLLSIFNERRNIMREYVLNFWNQ